MTNRFNDQSSTIENGRQKDRWGLQEQLHNKLHDEEKMLKCALGDQYKQQIEHTRSNKNHSMNIEHNADLLSLKRNEQMITLDQKLQNEKKKYIQEATRQDYDVKMRQKAND